MKQVMAVTGLLLASIAFADDEPVKELIDRFGLIPSSIASRDMPGWEQPAKVVVYVSPGFPQSGAVSRSSIRDVAGAAEVVFLDSSNDDPSAWADADVVFNRCGPDYAASSSIDYLHVYSAGVDRCSASAALVASDVIVTNSQKLTSEAIGEHAVAMAMSLARNLHAFRDLQTAARWQRQPVGYSPPVVMDGKTLLVLGLGGIGTQAAKRANALGMRVIGTRNSSREGPEFVDYVGLSSETKELALQADVVINALPLTDSTRGLIGSKFFNNLKPDAIYISVGRGATTDTAALMEALDSGKLRSAGLDVTDPEPLPADHPLWAYDSVIITPHISNRSDVSSGHHMTLVFENLRRYVNGDPLLNLVDLKRGY